MTDRTEANGEVRNRTSTCNHQMRTYKSIIIGEYRKRYRRCNCTGCDYHDTLLVPMAFSYKKHNPNTNVGIESIESIDIAPTLE